MMRFYNISSRQEAEILFGKTLEEFLRARTDRKCKLFKQDELKKKNESIFKANVTSGKL